MVLSMLPAQTALAEPVLSVTLGSATLSEGKYYYEEASVSGAGIRAILINFSGNVTSGDAITLPAEPAGVTVSASSNDYSKRKTLTLGLTRVSYRVICAAWDFLSPARRSP
jgi:hypothetical protein